MLIVFVEQDFPDPTAVLVCQAHTLKSSTRFLDRVDGFTTRLGRESFRLFGFPLRKIDAPFRGRDLVHDLLAVLRVALLPPPKVGSEMEAAEIGHGVDRLGFEWLSVSSSNEVGADFFGYQTLHGQIRVAEVCIVGARIAIYMKGHELRIDLRV